jgi:hypothetical protein
LAKFYWGEIESLGKGNKKMWQKIVDLGKNTKISCFSIQRCTTANFKSCSDKMSSSPKASAADVYCGCVRDNS